MRCAPDVSGPAPLRDSPPCWLQVSSGCKGKCDPNRCLAGLACNVPLDPEERCPCPLARQQDGMLTHVRQARCSATAASKASQRWSTGGSVASNAALPGPAGGPGSAPRARDHPGWGGTLHFVPVEAVRFDVFLSHNSADVAVVERIAERLQREEITPWLARWVLTPGDTWQPGISNGLRASRACAVFVGPHGLGGWAREELGVAQDRAAKEDGFRLFMVLLPGAVKPDDPSLAFLANRTWVDLRGGVDDLEGFQDLLSAISGARRAGGDDPGRCGWPGGQPAAAGVCAVGGMAAPGLADADVGGVCGRWWGRGRVGAAGQRRLPGLVARRAAGCAAGVAAPRPAWGGWRGHPPAGADGRASHPV